MDVVRGDEELCAPVRQGADGVRFPYFFVKCLAHIRLIVRILSCGACGVKMGKVSRRAA